MLRPLSDHPDAVRQRNRRDRLRGVTPGQTVPSSPPPRSAHVSPPPVSTSSAPVLRLHTTSPQSGPGPAAFSAPPVIPPATEGGAATPFVPTPEAPKATTTPEEASMLASAVAQFCAMGTTILLSKNPRIANDLGAMGVLPHFPTVFSYVKQCAERVAIKRNIQFRYADEVVVGAAIAVGVAGFVIKPATNDGGPAGAKNANPPPVADDHQDAEPVSPADAINEELEL